MLLHYAQDCRNELKNNMKVLVSGGAGFIGSALIRFLIQETDVSVINLDKLTYAASPEALDAVRANTRYHFEQVGICDREAVTSVFERHRPDAVMHLAAESHFDRSIDGPEACLQTNVVGTFVLLEAAREYLKHPFATGIEQTVSWYVDHQAWLFGSGADGRRLGSGSTG